MKGKVLIIGGAGFIGSHTADLLLKKGYKVRILDNLSRTVHQGTWPSYLDPKIEKIKGDVTRRSDWKKALKGIDFVFHFAAYQDLLPNFSKFFKVNTYGTSLLYEIIVKEKLPIKKVIVASTQFVYGEGKYQCQKHGIIYPTLRSLLQLKKGDWDIHCPICQKKVKPALLDESFASPQNHYSISKYAQELLSLRLGRLHQVPTVCLRYSIVQGPRQSFSNLYSGVLRIFTLSLLKNQSPPIYEDGKQLRDYVNVIDVARANLLVLENEKADFEVFNIGSGKGYSVLEFYEIVKKVLKKNIKPKIEGQFRKGDTRHSVSDISKIKKLGWQPKYTPEKSIKEYLKWILKQKIEKDYIKKAEEILIKSGTLLKAKLR